MYKTAHIALLSQAQIQVPPYVSCDYNQQAHNGSNPAQKILITYKAVGLSISYHVNDRL